MSDKMQSWTRTGVDAWQSTPAGMVLWLEWRHADGRVVWAPNLAMPDSAHAAPEAPRP